MTEKQHGRTTQTWECSSCGGEWPMSEVLCANCTDPDELDKHISSGVPTLLGTWKEAGILKAGQVLILHALIGFGASSVAVDYLGFEPWSTGEFWTIFAFQAPFFAYWIYLIYQEAKKAPWVSLSLFTAFAIMTAYMVAAPTIERTGDTLRYVEPPYMDIKAVVIFIGVLAAAYGLSKVKARV